MLVDLVGIYSTLGGQKRSQSAIYPDQVNKHGV